MLSKATATLPVVDVKRAIGFYTGKLGFEVTYEDEFGQAVIALADGSVFSLYQRGPTVADQTVLSLNSDDILADVASLRAKGVVFEDYTMPEVGLVTVDGIASLGPNKAAWFKDTEGNILSLIQIA
jgi:catechol 2,3-dioxygenase-like lactoylglutathione lyase family enzyme